MNPIERQSRFMTLLGDRDWEKYSVQENDFLELKIAYAFFGAPKIEDNSNPEEDEVVAIPKLKDDELAIPKLEDDELAIPKLEKMYTKEQVNQIKLIAKKVRKVGGGLSVQVAFVFVSSKESKEDYGVVSVKREGTAPPAFLDDLGRVYKSWDDFLQNNKLPPMVILYPDGGSYMAVTRLSSCKTPAKKISSKVLSVVDGAGIGIGLTAAALTFVPPLTTVAIGTGAVSTVWAVGRTVSRLVDRGSHNETLKPTDPKARSDWMMLASTLTGLTSASAMHSLRYLTSVGRTVSPIVIVSANAAQVVNCVVSGASMVDSIATAFKKGKVTKLDVLQISVQIFFFAHSVSTFKSAKEVLKQIQNETIDNYTKGLSKGGRKRFNKGMRRTPGKSDMERKATVIQKINNIVSSTDYSKKYKQLLNQTCQDGEQVTITENGILKSWPPLESTGNLVTDELWKLGKEKLVENIRIKMKASLGGTYSFEEFKNDISKICSLKEPLISQLFIKLISGDDIVFQKLRDRIKTAQPHQNVLIKNCLELLNNLIGFLGSGIKLFIKLKELIPKFNLTSPRKLGIFIKEILCIVIDSSKTEKKLSDKENLTRIVKSTFPELLDMLNNAKGASKNVQEIYHHLKSGSPLKMVGSEEDDTPELDDNILESVSRFWVSWDQEKEPRLSDYLEMGSRAFNRKLRLTDVENVLEEEDSYVIKLCQNSAAELCAESLEMRQYAIYKEENNRMIVYTFFVKPCSLL